MVQSRLPEISLQVFDALSQVAIGESYYGLAWSPDGKKLFASGGGAEVIHGFDFNDGYLAAPRQLVLRPANEQGIPGGLALSADGHALYVAESWGQRGEKISATDGRVLWVRSLAAAEGDRGGRHLGAEGVGFPAPFRPSRGRRAA